jgi:imidazolonepropionase-like amidohydrolase
MRVRVLVAAVLVAAAAALAAQQAPAPATPPLVLENVTIIDGTGAAPRGGMTVVLADGRISAIFAAGSRDLPAGARHLAVDGLYVVPGLIDTRVHLARSERPRALVDTLLRATLAGGVTTVGDMGGDGVVLKDLQTAARQSGAASPDILIATVFAGPDSAWFRGDPLMPLLRRATASTATPWLVGFNRATDLRAALGRAKAWGAAGVALDTGLTRDQAHAVTREARRIQLPVWSRVMVNPATPRDIAEANVTTMAHAEELAWGGAAGVLPPHVGQPSGLGQAMTRVAPGDRQVRAVLARMRERGAMLVPALYVLSERAALAGADRPEYDRQLAWAAAVTALAREEGVTIVAGTGAVGGATPNLHAELELLVERAGLTPLQAIRAATFDAARALGIAGEAGAVIEGRRADLLVLEADPSTDIRNTRAIRTVIKAGHLYD